MVISRPMMIVAGAAMDSAETPAAVFVHSSTSAAATMSLSATGSRNAPKEDTRFILRAR